MELEKRNKRNVEIVRLYLLTGKYKLTYKKIGIKTNTNVNTVKVILRNLNLNRNISLDFNDVKNKIEKDLKTTKLNTDIIIKKYNLNNYYLNKLMKHIPLLKKWDKYEERDKHLIELYKTNTWKESLKISNNEFPNQKITSFTGFHRIVSKYKIIKRKPFYKSPIYNIVSDMREKGFKYGEIVEYLNGNNYKTIHGKLFSQKHICKLYNNNKK